MALSTLHHVIDLEWMKEAYRLTRKDGAPGIDGVTAAEYAQDLEANLRTSWSASSLAVIRRRRSGGCTSPRVMEPDLFGPLAFQPSRTRWRRGRSSWCWLVYEQDFLSCSYGFRPGRSAHQALQALRTGFMSQGLRWVIDLDIENYFGSISHSHLRAFLDRRVTDGVIRRTIDKWLKAGVLEDGLLRHATEGSPQGGVISPCLSNIFLHHVLDEWFENEVQPRLKGEVPLSVLQMTP